MATDVRKAQCLVQIPMRTETTIVTPLPSQGFIAVAGCANIFNCLFSIQFVVLMTITHRVRGYCGVEHGRGCVMMSPHEV